MKQLTISTHRYSRLLEDFASAIASGGVIIRRAPVLNGGLFSVNCRYNHVTTAFIDGLMTLLTDIALQENPVYQHSPKLREMAGDLHSTPLYAAVYKDFAHFIKHSRTLHLEGYVAFRMTEYREKLDMMSYSLIKKMKLIQKD